MKARRAVRQLASVFGVWKTAITLWREAVERWRSRVEVRLDGVEGLVAGLVATGQELVTMSMLTAVDVARLQERVAALEAGLEMVGHHLGTAPLGDEEVEEPPTDDTTPVTRH